MVVVVVVMLVIFWGDLVMAGSAILNVKVKGKVWNRRCGNVGEMRGELEFERGILLCGWRNG